MTDTMLITTFRFIFNLCVGVGIVRCFQIVFEWVSLYRLRKVLKERVELSRKELALGLDLYRTDANYVNLTTSSATDVQLGAWITAYERDVALLRALVAWQGTIELNPQVGVGADGLPVYTMSSRDVITMVLSVYARQVGPLLCGPVQGIDSGLDTPQP